MVDGPIWGWLWAISSKQSCLHSWIADDTHVLAHCCDFRNPDKRKSQCWCSLESREKSEQQVCSVQAYGSTYKTINEIFGPGSSWVCLNGVREIDKTEWFAAKSQKSVWVHCSCKDLIRNEAWLLLDLRARAPTLQCINSLKIIISFQSNSINFQMSTLSWDWLLSPIHFARMVSDIAFRR
jgi:hypothetical protein